MLLIRIFIFVVLDYLLIVMLIFANACIYFPLSIHYFILNNGGRGGLKFPLLIHHEQLIAFYVYLFLAFFTPPIGYNRF